LSFQRLRFKLMISIALGASFLSHVGAQTIILSDQGEVQITGNRVGGVVETEALKNYVSHQLILKFRSNDPFLSNMDGVSDQNLTSDSARVTTGSTLSDAQRLLAAHNAKLISQSQESTGNYQGLSAQGANVGTSKPLLTVSATYLLEVDDENVQVLVDELQKLSDVEFAEPNYIYSVNLAPNDSLYGSLWGLEAINAPQAWDVSTGSESVVAVIDTGLFVDHPDIKKNVWVNSAEIPDNGIDDDANGKIDDINGWDFANKDNQPNDVHGHGTHVSGTIAAVGNNELGVIGVAYDAKVMALKALGDSGSGSSFNIASAIDYAAANGADVINMSLGGRGYSTTMANAVAGAVNSGVVVVVAAGNDSINSQYQFPANIPGVISVGSIAIDANGQLSKSGFSNSGPDVDVVAPGSNIISLSKSGGYVSFSGTSMAAPHVAGLSALILAKFPGMSVASVRSMLVAHTQDMSGTSNDADWNDIMGYGLIDAHEVLAANEISVTSRPDIVSPFINLPAKQNVQVKGLVEIVGSTHAPKLAYYEVAVALNGDELLFHTLYSSPQAKENEVLASWNTQGFENGTYIVRLRVFEQNGKNVDAFTRVYLDSSLEDGWPVTVSSWLSHPAGSTDGQVASRTPALIDLNGDGDMEIVTVNNNRGLHRYLYAFNNDGTRYGNYLFANPNVTEIVTPLTIADITGDGKDEIIFGARVVSSMLRESIFAYDTQGNLLPGFPSGWTGYRFEEDSVVTSFNDRIVATDVTGDGINELVLQKIVWNNTTKNDYRWQLMIIDNQGQVTSGWPIEVAFNSIHDLFTLGGGTLREIVLADWNHDGETDVIVIWPDASENIHARVFSASGQEIGRIQFPTSDLNAVRSPIVVDIDQDDVTEYLVHIGDEVYAYTMGGSNKIGWPIHIDATGARNPEYFGRSVTDMIVSDVDEDGDLEVVLSTISEAVVMNHDGTVNSALFNLGRHGAATYTGRTASINSIGEQGFFYGGMNDENLLQGRRFNGELLPNWPKRIAPISGGVSVADIDQDGKKEVVAHSLDGLLYVWELDSDANSLSFDWPLHGGNAAQTRSFNSTVPQSICDVGFSNVNLRGTFNAWENTPMQLNPSTCHWESVVNLTGDLEPRFKFDRFGDWSENYGDSNSDGIADRSGADIMFSEATGSYKIEFNSLTFEYTVVLQQVNESATVTFTCENGLTDMGTSVYVLGNIPELGGWNVLSEALKLSPATSYPTWSARINDLPVSADIEWKCVKANETSLAITQWQSGANNLITTGEHGSLGHSLGRF